MAADRKVSGRALLAVGTALLVFTAAFVAMAGPTWGAVVGPLGLLLGLASLLQEYRSPAAPATLWQRWADRLARVASRMLIATMVLGLIAGMVVVLAWRPGGDATAYNWPYRVQGLALLIVLILGIPSLLVGARDGIRGRWAPGASRLLAFVGPLIVLVVGEGLTPHLEIPWHQLVHTLFGSAPLTVLYLLALRKWHPALTRRR